MPTPPHSQELAAGIAHARKMAARAAQPLSSAHVLLSLFRYPNRARVLLAERSLDEARVQAALLRPGSAKEPDATLERLCDKAQDLAESVGAEVADCLHLMVAISRCRDSEAYRVLERTGTNLAQLRHAAVTTLTGAIPRRYSGMGPRRRPGLLARDDKRAQAHENTDLLRSLREAARSDAAYARRAERDLTMAQAEDDAIMADLDDPGPLPLSAGGGLWPDDSCEHGNFYGPEEPDEPLPPEGPTPPDMPYARGHDGHDGHGPGQNLPRPHHFTEVIGIPQGPPLTPLEELAPTLSECAIDLTAQALLGKLDAAIERDRELEALADVLGKRRANNPVLVGPPGVGKTAIVEGLALLWAEQRQHGGQGQGQDKGAQRRIVALDTGAMVAGTSLRGSFSERLGTIKTEVAQAQGQIVVFIDELHMLIGAGASGEGPQDAAGELKAALARGEFPCIGATTHDEFKRYIERDPALERRFTAIEVKEPSCEQAGRIVRGAIAPYEAHHQVVFSAAAIDAAVWQSHRFVTERKLPDKAFAALDLAGSRAHRQGASQVDHSDVAQVLHEWTGVPLARLAQADAARFSRAESHLSQHIVGHTHVVQAVAQALRRGFAGFNAKRPMGSFLFLGPTGVGKTEMVKVLAEFVFGQRDAIVRFDMSELGEKHSVARLLGAQPGYVGYEEGGQLTEALRKRPFQIVLFDEIEKAHPEVLNVLLQVLDEGHLTDTQGRRISFAHTVIILTSNLGAESALRPQSIGFGGSAASVRAGDPTGITQAVLEAARGQIIPELWGRLDEHLVFLPLSKVEVAQIAQGQLTRLAQTLHNEHRVRLTWDDSVVAFLLEHGGLSPTQGARGLRKALAKHIEAPMADLILTGGTEPDCLVQIARGDDGLILDVAVTGAPQPRGRSAGALSAGRA